MTGFSHSCGRALPNQPRICKDAEGRYLEAWCPDCQVGQTVRHVRRVWGVETVVREVRRATGSGSPPVVSGAAS